ncbi:chaplin [Streptomyces sp. NBRC 110611]|uniref:chaplin n=1 Tax=Streptomyces sp. NBRC 110611 TaxID=1621259 RepID=UPI0008347500|nr:chaplin [Streptomyces sp. NBRC 110611]
MTVRTIVAALATAAFLAGVGTAAADSGALGKATRTGGLLAGNSAALPLDIPFNDCGSSIGVAHLLNPAGCKKSTM